MAVKQLTERILFVAKCESCGGSKEVESNPPRERLCTTCDRWIPYVEISYVGPDKFGEKK